MAVEKITVGVEGVAVDNSGVKALNKIKQEVTKTTKSKGGRIKVPVDITIPIDENAKALSKAQAAIVKELDKHMAEGFSASGKDIDKLNSKFSNFTDEYIATGRKLSASPIYKEIQKQVKSINKSFDSLKVPNLQTKTNTSSRKSNTGTKNTRKKGYIDTGAISDEEIKGDIKNKRTRELSGLSGITKKMRLKSNSGIDPGRTNNYESSLSEISSYASGFERQIQQSLRETFKTSRASLVTYLDKDMASNAGKDGRKTTEIRQLANYANKAFKEVTELMSDLENGVEGVGEEDLKAQLGVLDTIYERQGRDLEQRFNKISKAIDAIYMGGTGRIGGSHREPGSDKGVGMSHEEVQAMVKSIYAGMTKWWDSSNPAESMAKRFYKDSLEISSSKKTTKKNSRSQYDEFKDTTKESDTYKQTVAAISQVNTEVKKATKATTAAKNSTDKQIVQDRNENSAERVADAKLASIEQTDANDGGNDAGNFERLTTDVEKIASTDKHPRTKSVSSTNVAKLDLSGKDVFSQILTVVISIDSILKQSLGISTTSRYVKKKDTSSKNGTPANTLPATIKPLEQALVPIQAQIQKALVPVAGTFKNYYEGKDIVKNQNDQRRRANQNNQEQLPAGRLQRSMIQTTVKDPSLAATRLKDAFAKLTNTTANYKTIMAKTSKEQDDLSAERIKSYGLANSTRPADNGDKTAIARRMSLFRGTDKFSEMFQNLKLTEGVNIDTTAVTDALSKVLSGKEMFEAQTGGALRNLLGSMTGYVGMPSLEKSRTQAEGLNQIMANIRKAMNDILNDIQNKESSLSGMEATGEAKFTADGKITEDSSVEAKTLVAQLEESKLVLASILADAGMVDGVVEQTNGKISQIVQKLGFTSPVLRENNTILNNINAGLDKNGKALKFQTRTGEVLNYSFQLMARNVGQVFKNFMSMINPLNLIKKAFSDFSSYNTKWQRTMNVIKYNIRAIIKPFMEWIAQQIVNVIGLVNALIKGIGSAFGKNWDLFDKSAASAEKMEEELEAATNVTAGFDELHDIGTDNTGANDLSGDIYTPQWEGLNSILEGIGEKIGKIAKAIKDSFQDGSFWKWLALAGAALVGFLALKKLISWFTGKNPLESVANGFSFLEKAVGWALLIWAFTAFTKALTDFVNCMKDADWETIAKSLVMLGGAFAELVASIAGVEGFTKLFEISASQLAGLAALVGVFDLFIAAIIPFIECINEIQTEASNGWEAFGEIAGAITTLAAAFGVLIASVAGIEKLTAVTALDWSSLLALAGIVGVFDLFVLALVPFFEAMENLSSGQILAGMAALAVSILAVAAAISILTTIALPALTAAITTGIGAVAVIALIGIIAVVALLVEAIGDAVQKICEGIAQVLTALDGAGDDIKLILEGISEVITSIATPIKEVIIEIIDKVGELSKTIAQEIGETIRKTIETIGEVVQGVIDSIINAIPKLLKSITDFCKNIGPSIKTSAEAIMQTVTEVVNFIVSAIEYLVNVGVDGINNIIGAVNSLSQYAGITLPTVQKIQIERFVPQYEKGTNYVPNDGLAYLHQGEAVIPKKYNEMMSNSDSLDTQLYLTKMMSTLQSLDSTIKQGISVKGQFTQRGSDLVAVVNKAKSQAGATILSNAAYAR